MIVTHDGADTIIIRQLASLVSSEVLVLADDTGIFVLSCHFVFVDHSSGHYIMMMSPIRGRSITYINQSHRPLMGNLLAAHGLQAVIL